MAGWVSSPSLSHESLPQTLLGDLTSPALSPPHGKWTGLRAAPRRGWSAPRASGNRLLARACIPRPLAGAGSHRDAAAGRRSERGSIIPRSQVDKARKAGCRRDRQGSAWTGWTSRACLKRWPQTGSDQPGSAPAPRGGCRLPGSSAAEQKGPERRPPLLSSMGRGLFGLWPGRLPWTPPARPTQARPEEQTRRSREKRSRMSWHCSVLLQGSRDIPCPYGAPRLFPSGLTEPPRSA